VVVTPLDDESETEARERVLNRFAAIGTQIMNRTSGGAPFAENPIAGVLSDREKKRLAAQILGQAYVSAHNLMLHNKEAVSRIADELVVRREVFGDELLEILDRAQLRMPEIDLASEDSWPRMCRSAAGPSSCRRRRRRCSWSRRRTAASARGGALTASASRPCTCCSPRRSASRSAPSSC